MRSRYPSPMKTRRLALVVLGIAAAATFATACGSKKKAVNFSEPVGISLSAHKQDITGTILSVQKNINTEAGNPFGKFVTDARAALKGNDPSSVGLTSLVLTLSSSSSVTGFEQVMSGPVAITFIMNGSAASYLVGAVTNPTGVTADLSHDFDTTSMTAPDYQAF